MPSTRPLHSASHFLLLFGLVALGSRTIYGELYVGAQRGGPIYARVWIDQEMKKKMGF